MVNAVHQSTLLFFYVVAFALLMAAVCGKSWIIDERKDNTALLGEQDTHYVSYISLWKFYDWKDNESDISDLYNGCEFRRHGFQSVRGFLILAIISTVAQIIVLALVMFDRARDAQKQRLLMRILQGLHSWATLCVFIVFTIFAGISEKECNGQELAGRNFDYGWCFAFVVSIFVLYGFQLLALLLTPHTYFRVSKKYRSAATATPPASSTSPTAAAAANTQQQQPAAQQQRSLNAAVVTSSSSGPMPEGGSRIPPEEASVTGGESASLLPPHNNANSSTAPDTAAQQSTV